MCVCLFFSQAEKANQEEPPSPPPPPWGTTASGWNCPSIRNANTRSIRYCVVIPDCLCVSRSRRGLSATALHLCYFLKDAKRVSCFLSGCSEERKSRFSKGTRRFSNDRVRVELPPAAALFWVWFIKKYFLNDEKWPDVIMWSWLLGINRLLINIKASIHLFIHPSFLLSIHLSTCSSFHHPLIPSLIHKSINPPSYDLCWLIGGTSTTRRVIIIDRCWFWNFIPFPSG